MTDGQRQSSTTRTSRVLLNLTQEEDEVEEEVKLHPKSLIQGATKKHARLRPFPFLCEILIQFHEKIIKFDQIFVKQKIRV